MPFFIFNLLCDTCSVEVLQSDEYVINITTFIKNIRLGYSTEVPNVHFTVMSRTCLDELNFENHKWHGLKWETIATVWTRFIGVKNEGSIYFILKISQLNWRKLQNEMLRCSIHWHETRRSSTKLVSTALRLAYIEVSQSLTRKFWRKSDSLNKLSLSHRILSKNCHFWNGIEKWIII